MTNQRNYYVIEIFHEMWDYPEFKEFYGVRSTANRRFRELLKHVRDYRIASMSMYIVPDDEAYTHIRASWRLVRQEYC